MPEFDYTAKELNGTQVAGTLTATTEQDALSILAGKQLFPQRVVQSEASRRQTVRGSRRVASRNLTTFYNQLADLLRSGVPLLRSLLLLEDQTSNPALKYVIQDVREHVAEVASAARACHLGAEHSQGPIAVLVDAIRGDRLVVAGPPRSASFEDVSASSGGSAPGAPGEATHTVRRQ